jgi:hypothetical protein
MQCGGAEPLLPTSSAAESLGSGDFFVLRDFGIDGLGHGAGSIAATWAPPLWLGRTALDLTTLHAL